MIFLYELKYMKITYSNVQTLLIPKSITYNNDYHWKEVLLLQSKDFIIDNLYVVF